MHQAVFEQMKRKETQQQQHEKKTLKKKAGSLQVLQEKEKRGKWMEWLKELVPMATVSQRGFISQRRDVLLDVLDSVVMIFMAQ